MAIFLHNRVKETSITSGSGSVALAGAATGFQAFSNVLSSGQQTFYTIENSPRWEVGIGTYGSSSLSRDTILSSSDGGSKINLSGNSNVFIAYPSEKSVYKDENDQVVAGSSGVILATGSPSSTSNTLYNIGGSLYFNGSVIGGLTYTAGTGLVLDGAEFNVTDPVIQSGDNISLLNNDAGYLTSESDTLQTVTDRGSNTTNSITTSGNITATTGIFDILDLTLIANGDQPAHSEGVVFYDSDNHTLSLYNDEADVTLQLGQEEYVRVRNNTGSTITNGQVVKINGSQGQAPTICLAIADSDANSQVIGLATHDIEDSSFGYVTTYGLVRGIATSGITEGSEIFLDASTSGAYTETSPTIPNYKVTVGHVIISHPNNGMVLVQPGQPKLGGGDLKSEGSVTLSGVPFVTAVADSTAGAVQTTSSFVYDSGNQTLLINGSEVQVSGDNVSNFANDAGYLTAHPVISAASSSDNSGRTYIQDIILDSNGHVTGIAVATETVVNTDTTYTAGTGLSLAGTEFNIDETVIQSGDNVSFLSNDAGYLTAHPVISAASSSDNSGRTYIQDIILDSNGHVTGITAATETVTDTTYTAGTGLSLDGTEFNIDTTVIQSGDNISLLNNDSGYLTAESDTLEAVIGRGSVATSDFTASGLFTAATGVELQNNTPATTTNKLYNVGGVLHFNGSGVNSDSSGGGSTSPSGADTYVQFNNSGEFGGDSRFTWNSGTSTLAVGGSPGKINIAGVVNGTGGELLIEESFGGDPVCRIWDRSGGATIGAFELYDNNATNVYLTGGGTGGTFEPTSFLRNGSMVFGRDPGTETPDYMVEIQPESVGDVALVVNTIVSQTADMQQWNDSNGNTMALVDVAGNIETSGYVRASGMYLRSNSDNTSVYITETTTSQRQNTVAIGYGATPQRDNSVLVGSNTDGSDNATALGYNAGNAQSTDSVHIGYNTDDKASWSVMIGSQVTGWEKIYSVGIGYQADTNIEAVAIGNQVSAGIYSVAIGSEAIAPSGAVTIGYQVSGVADRVTIQPSSVLHAGPHLLDEGTPASTTNTLYNVSGVLYFNGSGVNGGTTYTAGTGLLLDGTEFNIDNTVIQSGDNISLLNNDAGYITSTPTLSGVNWNDFSTNYSGVPYQTGTNPDGEVWVYDYNNYQTLFRLVPTGTPAADDAFYTSWSDPTLSGLVATRGDISGGGNAAGTGLTLVDNTMHISGVPNSLLENSVKKRAINFISDGGGSVLTTGVKSYVTVPYDCTVQSWTILAENSGSVVVDVWKDTYANYPPTVADTIAGSEKPTISSGVKNQDNSLTTWTTALSQGDVLGFNIDSVTDITKISLSIDVEVT